MIDLDAFIDTWTASDGLPDAVRHAVRGILIDTWPQDIPDLLLDSNRKDDGA